MRHALLLAFLTALPSAALAQQTDAPREAQDIVVTGTRIQDYRDRLAACLARNCPTNEDVDATMALAEALFVEGDYHQARTAIRASLSRNRRAARNYPEPVSDLYRANARVARNLGLDRDATSSTREILRALQAGLPVEDHRHFTARLEIAQSLLAFGEYDEALRGLRELARRARAAGRDDVAAVAELRSLWVTFVQDPHGNAAVRELVAMSRSPDTRRAVGARMLLVRIYSERRETRMADAMIAELGRGSQRRQLLYSPPYELGQGETSGGRTDRANLVKGATANGTRGFLMANSADRMVGNFEDKWIDVGFRVRPDGRVEEPEIIRRSGETIWAAPLLASIRGRRYAAGDSATYRLERYTYTSRIRHDTTGTRIAARSPRARVEYFDLGEGGAPPPSQPAARGNDLH